MSNGVPLGVVYGLFRAALLETQACLTRRGPTPIDTAAGRYRWQKVGGARDLPPPDWLVAFRCPLGFFGRSDFCWCLIPPSVG